MAETYLKARSVLILIDADDNGTFLPVACLTDNGLTTDNAPIDQTSKCGDQMAPGDSFTQEITGTGLSIDITGTPASESYAQLYDLMVAKTVFPLKYGPADPVSGDSVFEGDCFVSNLELQAPDKENATFDVTFTVKNPPMTRTTY